MKKEVMERDYGKINISIPFKFFSVKFFSLFH